MQTYDFFEKYTREVEKLTERIPMTRVPGEVRRFVDTKIAELAKLKNGKVDLGEVIRYLLITHPEFREFLEENNKNNGMK